MSHPDRLVPLNALEATDRMGAAAAQSGGGTRISKDYIESQISMIFYVLGDNAARAGMGEVFDSLSFDYGKLEHITICMLVMKNGFTVIGMSAPLDVRNYDPNVGKINAYENAFRQLWPLMAFSRLDHP